MLTIRAMKVVTEHHDSFFDRSADVSRDESVPFHEFAAGDFLRTSDVGFGLEAAQSGRLDGGKAASHELRLESYSRFVRRAKAPVHFPRETLISRKGEPPEATPVPVGRSDEALQDFASLRSAHEVTESLYGGLPIALTPLERSLERVELRDVPVDASRA